MYILGQEPLCQSQPSCSECIRSPGCAWCTQTVCSVIEPATRVTGSNDQDGEDVSLCQSWGELREEIAEKQSIHI